MRASALPRSPPIPVTLHFWVAWDPQQADGIAAKKEIAAYEEAHPDVKIDVQNITYDALHDKLLDRARRRRRAGPQLGPAGMARRIVADGRVARHDRGGQDLAGREARSIRT